MSTSTDARTGPLRREWAAFRTPGRIAALVVAGLVLVGYAAFFAYANRSTCSDGTTPVACPTDPVGPDGHTVADHFVFAHRGIGERASLTVRLTAMTGTRTYPPPHHDRLVAGLVPWAKVGIIVKDGLRRGSSYAALMLTGDHGVRLQYDYRHDIAGAPGGVTPTSPRWLRLTRTGGIVTAAESADGTHWTRVGRVRPHHLGRNARIGLFAASPGDLTLQPAGLGGAVQQERFAQASGTFDHVRLTGATSSRWVAESLGEMGETDWERHHKAPGLVAHDGSLTVTGSGDIGPIGDVHAASVEDTLGALPIALLLVLIVAARFGAGRRARPPSDRRELGARLVVTMTGTFLIGLLAAAVTVPLGTALLRTVGAAVIEVPIDTRLRVVLGAAGLLAVGAALGFGLGALLRRAWVAALAAAGTVVLPYALATLPLLPDPVSNWLLRTSPAAGFAVLQSIERFPQVLAHYAPSAGYLPLPWWAGFALAGGYAALVAVLAVRRCPAGATAPPARSATPSRRPGVSLVRWVRERGR